ncbi:hypothetical protein J6590_080277 [Homalodisca vitripennis]|nr:hypothetical protein J6590_080277 [Homalodisca vitripennis]
MKNSLIQRITSVRLLGLLWIVKPAEIDHHIISNPMLKISCCERDSTEPLSSIIFCCRSTATQYPSGPFPALQLASSDWW